MAQTRETLQERAEMLETTRWVSEFSWKEIENMARYFVVSKKEKGMTVFLEGDHEKYMGLVVRGSVNVIKKDAKQQDKILSVIGKSGIFGEMMLFDGEPRSATIVAAEPTVLLILSQENLDCLVKEIPVLAAKLLWKLGKILSQRLRMTSGKLIDFID